MTDNAAERTCNWWWDDPCWASDCGMAFDFHDGGPVENEFNFCPGCGKEVCQLGRNEAKTDD